MSEPPQQVSIVVHELRAAVPIDAFARVRAAIRARGMVIRDLEVHEARQGLIVHAEKVIELDMSRVSMRRSASDSEVAGRQEPSFTPELDVESLQTITRQIRVEIEVMSGGRPPTRVWLKVFSTLLVPTGFELHVIDELDADHQLEVLADVASLPRRNITICPKPGWEGYR